MQMEFTLLNSKVYGIAQETALLNEKSHTQQSRIDRLVADVGGLAISKEDASAAQGTVERLEKALKVITTDLDKKQNKIQTVEQFIDRYIPIRIQSQISETLGAVLTRQLLTKLEHYEQAKYKFTMLSKKKSQQGPDTGRRKMAGALKSS